MKVRVKISLSALTATMALEEPHTDEEDSAGRAMVQDAVTRSGRTANRPAYFVEESEAQLETVRQDLRHWN